MSNRPLTDRLAEYRDSLTSIASQLDKQIVPFARENADPHVLESLQDAIKLYTLIAGDLTRLLDGDELREFIVTGVIPE